MLGKKEYFIHLALFLWVSLDIFDTYTIHKYKCSCFVLWFWDLLIDFWDNCFLSYVSFSTSRILWSYFFNLLSNLIIRIIG